MQEYVFQPIATIDTPFKEKFAIPRQAGIVSAAKGVIRFTGDPAQAECFEKIEGYSHLWLIWIFHAVPRGEWNARVRPPRLGGNTRVGVFASRSPFRPNPIGLSVVKLDRVVVEKGQVELVVSGVDMMDGTPILDIKPYVPYSDSLDEAVSGFAVDPPQAKLEVHFSSQAESQLQDLEDSDSVKKVINGILSLDPRPAYRQAEESGEYGILLYDFDLRWRVKGSRAEVIELAIPPEFRKP